MAEAVLAGFMPTGRKPKFTITADMVADLQEELMPLQVALDDLQLQQITLGSLLQGS